MKFETNSNHQNLKFENEIRRGLIQIPWAQVNTDYLNHEGKEGHEGKKIKYKNQNYKVKIKNDLAAKRHKRHEKQVKS